MRVVFVVDNISNIKQKIELLKKYYGNNIIFIVKAHFSKLFATFGYNINAIYVNNLARTIHFTLNKLQPEDTIIYYSSLNIDTSLLNNFTKKINNKQKIVNVMPKYNWLENVSNNLYNVYVKSLFHSKDSMASPKLQFLPAMFVNELLASHIGNKLFELRPEYVTNLYIEDKEICKQLKPKAKFNKFNLIPIIVALVITYLLIACLIFFKSNFFVILSFVFLYILDIVIAFIFHCKLTFDNRFLK